MYGLSDNMYVGCMSDWYLALVYSRALLRGHRHIGISTLKFQIKWPHVTIHCYSFYKSFQVVLILGNYDTMLSDHLLPLYEIDIFI